MSVSCCALRGPICDSYLTAAAAKHGAAAADAAARKHTRYRNDIPGLAHFVPLALESVRGVRQPGRGAPAVGSGQEEGRQKIIPPGDAEKEAKALVAARHWTDELAVVHARYLARAIYHRAVACNEAGNPSYARTVDTAWDGSNV
jgi:hypothetical protein